MSNVQIEQPEKIPTAAAASVVEFTQDDNDDDDIDYDDDDDDDDRYRVGVLDQLACAQTFGEYIYLNFHFMD